VAEYGRELCERLIAESGQSDAYEFTHGHFEEIVTQQAKREETAARDSQVKHCGEDDEKKCKVVKGHDRTL
jgi:hypothetical protein